MQSGCLVTMVMVSDRSECTIKYLRHVFDQFLWDMVECRFELLYFSSARAAVWSPASSLHVLLMWQPRLLNFIGS